VEAVGGRWGAALGKLLLLAASLLVVFALFEWLVVPRLLVRPPHRFQGGFSLLMQVVSQHSKRDLIPRDYVLLVGDSYAKGYGDWLAAADPAGNDPYHSAHVIQERLGRDVLSYGKGGAGSIGGLVLFPARWDLALARRGLEPPDVVAVYFYEGNDLNDNRRYLGDHFPGGREGDGLMDDAVFDAFLREELDAYLTKKSLLDRSFTAAYLYKRVRGSIEDRVRELLRDDPPPSPPAVAAAPPEAPAPALNRVRIGGELVALPDRIQSPALELSEEELERSLHVTGRSLALLVERYPDSRVILFRIPSPIATYELVTDRVHVQSYDYREPERPAAQVETYSDRIGAALAGYAAELGIEYVDVRPIFRKAARERAMHGPADWQHLNRDGYTVLGEVVAERIEAGGGAR
jgi:hypothetical protein